MKSPLQCYHIKGRPIWIKREDQIQAFCSGNKYRKLVYNIEEARRLKSTQLLSFGGAFSNHLYALATGGENLGWATVGMIRGEDDHKNPSLTYLRKKGMQLHFISRSEYRRKNEVSFLERLNEQFPGCYILPEGGSNALAMRGVAEVCSEIQTQLPKAKYLICPIGSGGTAAGLLAALPDHMMLIVVNVLKGIDQSKTIYRLLGDALWEQKKQQLILVDNHLGGFARYHRSLVETILHYWHSVALPLDPIYNAKVMIALERLIDQKSIAEDDQIVMLHTGGLQGIGGFNYRFDNCLSALSHLLQ